MAKSAKCEEHAQKSYFFGQGYRELGKTIASAWKKNKDRIVESVAGVKDSWKNINRNWYKAICLTIFKTVILLSVVIFGSLFTAVFTALHVILLGLLMVLVYIGFVLLRTIDSAFCLVKGIATNCYYCERKFTLPVYMCPNCGVKHNKLIPSKYGVFKRKCECGAKIPTTFINGRQKLESCCPHCGQPSIGGMHKSILIPVVGGANAGKTCFISMAINQVEQNAAALGLDYQYQCVNEDRHDENIKWINRGLCPQKTSLEALKYYNFYLTPQKDKVKNLISVCDIAGEVFTNQQKVATQQGYRFADAIIVTVDPLSIREYDAEIKKKLASHEYNALSGSTQPINDVLSALINTMEALYRLKAKDVIKKSVVIVFTKNDIFDLEERIGAKAVANWLANQKSKDICAAYNAVCEDFLTSYGENSFLNTVKGKFSNVQFFSCSALGHPENGNKFEPVDVEKPLLWVVDKVSKNINLSNLWGKKI